MPGGAWPHAFILTRDRKNVLVLATCQTLFGIGRMMIILTAPLIAYFIAEERALATLPHALVIVGTAAATLPASLFMRRVGRRWGFVTGAAIGTIGGAVAAVGLLTTSFALFCLGIFLYGVSAGFAQLYRFAAADVAAADFKGRAVSLVLAAGVIASLIGPELAKIGADLVVSPQFLGAYIFLMATTLLSGIIVSLIDIPPLTQTEIAGAVRPMSAIMRQPAFVAAVLAAMVAQAVMNLLMVATPIAMARFNHQFVDTALVIQWHGVCMFAPGFFTGSLIRRHGEIRIILGGLALVLASVAIALSGQTVFLMWAAMAVLGLGWNFAFTAGTTLLVEAHTPAERAKVQGTVNMLIYTVAAIASLSSGTLLHYLGWTWVNLCALPLIAVAIAATLWFARHRRNGQTAPTSTTITT